jgi:hypothetical protein
LKKTATDAANGSFAALESMLEAMIPLSDAQLLLYLPAPYANLHIDDIPSLDVIDEATFPSLPLQRLFLALKCLTRVPKIPQVALSDMWLRVWECIQVLEAARRYHPNGLGDDIVHHQENTPLVILLDYTELGGNSVEYARYLSLGF